MVAGPANLSPNASPYNRGPDVVDADTEVGHLRVLPRVKKTGFSLFSESGLHMPFLLTADGVEAHIAPHPDYWRAHHCAPASNPQPAETL